MIWLYLMTLSENNFIHKAKEFFKEQERVCLVFGSSISLYGVQELSFSFFKGI